MVVPDKIELKYENIVLRNYSEEDYDFFKDMLSDPKTAEFLIYPPAGWTQDLVKKRYENRIELQKKDKCVGFSILVEGELVGECGIFDLDLDHKHARFGIIIHHPFWGKKVGTTARLLCFQFAFEELRLHRLTTGTFAENFRVRNFYEKLGIKLEAILKEAFYVKNEFKDNYLFAIFESDWPNIKKKMEQSLKTPT